MKLIPNIVYLCFFVIILYVAFSGKIGFIVGFFLFILLDLLAARYTFGGFLGEPPKPFLGFASSGMMAILGIFSLM